MTAALAGLRRLAACANCGRQYVTGDRGPGDRFRCLCGELVTVPVARPHEAAVVHCSACGGPRQGGAAKCGFCGGDFTVHELDLDTLCPRCATRLPRRARFCHACASPITASDDAGTRTEFACPACGSGREEKSWVGREGKESAGRVARGRGDGTAVGLVSRRLAAGSPVAVLECPTCVGLWVERAAFLTIADDARRGSLPASMAAEPAEVPRAPVAPPGAIAYRPCPVCGKLMNRQNFGRKSGVVVDHCRQHGTWFDGDELVRVLTWLRRGGEERAAELAVEEERARQRQKKLAEPAEDWAGGDPESERGGWLGRLLVELFDLIGP